MGKIIKFQDRTTNETQFPITLGEAVTVKPGDTPINLDVFLRTMVDGLFPIGEIKTFAVESPNLEFLESMGQEWVFPDGSLLERTKYPVLFSLIGYKYGWGDTNPFTGDLDAKGNALPTSTDHKYFRLPDFRANFLRVVGERTLTNEWTDSDGTSHSLETTYKAEMYKRQLDAIRNINGDFNSVGWMSGKPSDHGAFKAEKYGVSTEHWWKDETYAREHSIQSSRVVPTDIEIVPVNMGVNAMIRIV